jgi:hypothetical protein
VQWVLHTWGAISDVSPARVEILTGPAGGHFYVDAVEAFKKNVPWSQQGYDRSISGRTGGYTDPGGSPDEYFQASVHLLAP